MMPVPGLLLSLLLTLSTTAPAGPPIAWEPWSDEAFSRAGKEKRLVLVDVEAVWCHWCHVMDETTYHDPDVTRLVAAHFVAVQVDQDAQPDISNRYEDYGWPATVVLAPDGRELVKLQGYIPPARMASLLQAVIDDPTPGPSVTGAPGVEDAPAAQAALSPELRAELEQLVRKRYDTENGGWGFVHKFLSADDVEWCLQQSRRGDQDAERMARQTLAAEQKLLDPVWGGAYQYSDSGDWDHPHFEKIMSRQADDLRVFAHAYALWHDPAHLRAATGVARYLREVLTSPEGAFYTSQDADVVPGQHSGEYFALDERARRRQGVPRVDRHLYARENGWAIAALAALYDVTREPATLRQATRAAEWVVAHRLLPGGGFRHGERDAGGPFLGDTVSMGRAFLALYAVTGERPWLDKAGAAAGFLARTFRREPAGFATALATPAGQPPQRDENVMVARLASRLARETGDASFRDTAQHALRWLATPAVAHSFGTGGLLLAADELAAADLSPSGTPKARAQETSSR
jgi:hypothetical protein